VCAAALANLDIIEREQLISQVRRLAPQFRRRLEALRHHAIVGDVRAIGLMGAVELVQNRATKQTFPPETNIAARVRKKAIERGVIVRASVDNVVLCPPFIITPKQLDQLFDTVDAAIAEVANEL
jgi:4-aminobutyrate--pyruvate transaminase